MLWLAVARLQRLGGVVLCLDSLDFLFDIERVICLHFWLGIVSLRVGYSSIWGSCWEVKRSNAVT